MQVEADGLRALADPWLRGLMETSTDIVVQIDISGRIRYASPAVERYGYDCAALIGRDPSELIHPEDRARSTANLAAALRGEPAAPLLERQNRYIAADGGLVWLEGNPRAIHDADGRPLGVINILRDITEARALQAQAVESMRWASMAEELAEVGYWRLNVETGETAVSEQMYRLLGLPPGPPPSLADVLAMTHPDDRPASAERFQRAMKTGEGWPAVVVRVVRPDGAVRELEGRSVCETDPDGAVVAVFGTLHDITERRAQAGLFEAAFTHAAFGKALVAPDGSFLRVNDSFCRVVGYPATDLLKLSFQAITHPDDLEEDARGFRQLTEGVTDSYRMNKRYLRADGGEVWAHLNVSVVRHPDGRPRCFVAQIEDLTPRRKAEAALRESEARYRRIAENTSDIIVMTDLAGRVTYASAAIACVGYSPEDLLGQAFWDHVHPADGPVVRRAFAGLLRGGDVPRVRWRGRRKDGAWMWLESRPSLLSDPTTGEAAGFLDVLRDVDDQVRQEEALAKARVEAAAAGEAKAQFLANLSHEIRTPLTAVLGFTDLLHSRDDLPAQARDHVGRVAAAGRGLLSLINDVLDLSRLDAGGFEIRPTPTDIVAVAQESLLLFAPQAEAKGIEIAFLPGDAIPQFLQVDGDRLRQALINLIGNAVKFTDQGAVTLELTYAGGQLALSVADTGPGLTVEDCARLFQRFTQVDGSTRRRHGGTGLGLAISRGLAEAMDGRIDLHSEPGRGSTFTIVVPALPAEAPAAAAGALPTLEGLRVLVVDDNPHNRELASALLHALGAVVEVADGGEAALTVLGEAAIDAVLLDLHMPGLSGPETLQLIRAQPGPGRETPVIAFSADAQPDERSLAGFDGVVSKPIVMSQLCEALIRSRTARSAVSRTAAA